MAPCEGQTGQKNVLQLACNKPIHSQATGNGPDCSSQFFSLNEIFRPLKRTHRIALNFKKSSRYHCCVHQLQQACFGRYNWTKIISGKLVNKDVACSWVGFTQLWFSPRVSPPCGRLLYSESSAPPPRSPLALNREIVVCLRLAV